MIVIKIPNSMSHYVKVLLAILPERSIYPKNQFYKISNTDPGQQTDCFSLFDVFIYYYPPICCS